MSYPSSGSGAGAWFRGSPCWPWWAKEARMTPALSANRPDRCRHPPRTPQRPDARVHKNVHRNTHTQLSGRGDLEFGDAAARKRESSQGRRSRGVRRVERRTLTARTDLDGHNGIGRPPGPAWQRFFQAWSRLSGRPGEVPDHPTGQPAPLSPRLCHAPAVERWARPGSRGLRPGRG